MVLKNSEEEQKHKFDKKLVQNLVAELFSFAAIAHVYYDNVCTCEQGPEVKCIMKHILKLADNLYYELDAWEILP